MKKNFLRKTMALILITVTLSQSFPTLFLDLDAKSITNLVLDLDLDNEAENESEKEKNKELDEEKNKVYPSAFAFKLNELKTTTLVVGMLFHFSNHSKDIFLPPPELELAA